MHSRSGYSQPSTLFSFLPRCLERPQQNHKNASFRQVFEEKSQRPMKRKRRRDSSENLGMTWLNNDFRIHPISVQTTPPL